jgi:flavin reductase (DIM6/NTAB) family NADH-FMN oxidoreductase RutF
MEKNILRQAFSQFATGVTIITIRRENKIYGMTVNSFTSVSLDPPLLLWCLAKENEGKEETSYALFKDIEDFSVTILSARQENYSRDSAQHNKHELTEDDLSEGLFLKGAIAGFSCVINKKIEAGDHTIMIGAIKQCKTFDETKTPLLFYKRQYRALE